MSSTRLSKRPDAEICGNATSLTINTAGITTKIYLGLDPEKLLNYIMIHKIFTS